MTDHRSKERELLVALNNCRALARQGVRAELADDFGVLYYRGGSAVGIWSYHGGHYRFRTLANWDPIRLVITIDEAIVESRQL
jgi:hypothetical protein